MTEEELKDKIIGLRLEFGDTDDQYLILQDAEYKYLINKYGDNERSLSTQTTFTFLAKLAVTSVRERVGQEERYGNNAFDNYIKLLQLKLKDPSFGNIAPISYFGGVYKDLTEYYEKSPEFTITPFYQGSDSGYPTWRGKRIYKANGRIIEPYEFESRMTDVRAYP